MSVAGDFHLDDKWDGVFFEGIPQVQEVSF